MCVSSWICLHLALFRHILTGPAILQHLTTFRFSPRQPRDQDMSLQSTTQRLTVQGGRISGQPQQHSSLDQRGTAELSGPKLQPQNMLHADTPPDMCEDVLLKTLHNLVVEAVRTEFDLTAPPHASHRFKTHSLVNHWHLNYNRKMNIHIVFFFLQETSEATVGEEDILKIKTNKKTRIQLRSAHQWSSPENNGKAQPKLLLTEQTVHINYGQHH